jgi:hypothetical protein
MTARHLRTAESAWSKEMRAMRLLALIGVIISTRADAAFISGNDLYNSCNQGHTEVWNAMHCLGYITGIADVMIGDGVVSGYRVS